MVAYNPNRPQPQPAGSRRSRSRHSTVDALGLKLARPTPEWRKYFSLPDGVRSVVVVEVPQNSPAANQGLRAGDLLVDVGSMPVATPEELVQRVGDAKKAGRKYVLVRVEREGNYRFITLPIETG